MMKRIAIIWLVGLFCFNSAGGFFTVICHGSDGHVAVEPMFHSHCQCPDTDNSVGYPVAIGSLANHDHCSDVVTVSSFTIPSKSTARQSVFKVFASCFNQKMALPANTSVAGFFAVQGDNFSSFHVPLQTVILLA